MTSALSSPPLWQYYIAMSEELAEAVREILDAVPGSDRELSLEAGVPPSTISRIRQGERGCTPEVARALVEVLSRWSEDCREAETKLRRALQAEEGPMGSVTRDDPRYVDAEHPDAALRAWAFGTVDMGGWTDPDSPEAFRQAVQDEHRYGAGEPVPEDDLEIVEVSDE